MIYSRFMKSITKVFIFFLVAITFVSCNKDESTPSETATDTTDSTSDTTTTTNAPEGSFSIQGSVVDGNGIAISGAVVQVGSDGVQSTTTSSTGIYSFSGLEGSKWDDNDQNGIWSSGDSISGTYSISVVVNDASHNATAVIRNAIVGSTINSGVGVSEDWFPIAGSATGPNGEIDTLFECTGTEKSIDFIETSSDVYPIDLDGDGVIGKDGTCAKGSNEVCDGDCSYTNTDKAVSEDRNGNGVLDIYSNGTVTVEAGTNNYDFIIPETNSSLQATVLDAHTLVPISGAVISLERTSGGYDYEYHCEDLTGQDIRHSYSTPFSTVTSSTNGLFTLSGLIAADVNCDRDYDLVNHITVSASGYETIQFESDNPVLPRKVYSLGHFTNDFPGAEEAGIIYLTRTYAAIDTTAPYVTAVSFDTTSSFDGYITTTVPTSIKIKFNEGLTRNLDGIYQNAVITIVGFAGGDYTSNNFSPFDFASKIEYQESTTGSGVYDTLVLTPQVPLYKGFRYQIDLTDSPLTVRDLALNQYLGWIDTNSNESWDMDSSGGSTSGESLDILSYNVSSGSTAGILDFSIFQETGTFDKPTVLVANADTGNASYIEPTAHTYIDWNPVLDSNGNQSYGYRIWGQAVDTTQTSEQTVGPYVAIGEVELNYSPATEYSWAAGKFWETWIDSLYDTTADILPNPSFAYYKLSNEIQGEDPWQLVEMNVKVGPIDINGLEGTKSDAARVMDNTPPRIGTASLNPALRHYPFARLSLDSTAPDMTRSDATSDYVDSTSSTGAFAVKATRDEYRDNDSEKRHYVTIKTSEPIAKASLNIDENTDGIPDNIALNRDSVTSDSYFDTDLNSADQSLYYDATADLSMAVNDIDVASPAGVGARVMYNSYDISGDSFNNWPGVDVNMDNDTSAALKYQLITLGFENIFNIRTGQGIQLGTGITDLHGNSVPSDQKLAYLVDGIPPLIENIDIDSTNDFIEVTFTEPVNPDSVSSGLALTGLLVADENNPNIDDGISAGYTQIYDATGDATPYLYNSDQTQVRVYVTDTSLIPYNATGTKLVANTTVEDLAPDVIRYNGVDNITGANTVANDAAGSPLSGSDTGVYLNAYAGLNGVQDVDGYISTIGPRVSPTAPGTPLAINTSASIHGGDMQFTPNTVTVSFTKPMNYSLDMYQDDFNTSICNPANYAVSYNTAGTNGNAGSDTAAVYQLTCTSNQQVTLTLKRAVANCEYDISGTTVTCDTSNQPSDSITAFRPYDTFGASQLNGFGVNTSTLQRDSDTAAMTNVTALHFISDGDVTGDTDGYFANANNIRIQVILLTTDNSDGNNFELEATVPTPDAGSVVSPTHYTLPSNYKIYTIESTSSATTIGDGEYVVVNIALYKDAVGTQTLTGGGADGTSITATYGTSTEDFDEDSVTLGSYTTPAITVSGVVDAQGYALDTRNNRETYTWTRNNEQTVDEEDVGTEISAGFHSLRVNR